MGTSGERGYFNAADCGMVAYRIGHKNMNKNRAVFLDLNGTLVLPLKQETLEEMYLIAGADVAVQ